MQARVSRLSVWWRDLPVGWIAEKEASRRPVDILAMANRALLLADVMQGRSSKGITLPALRVSGGSGERGDFWG